MVYLLPIIRAMLISSSSCHTKGKHVSIPFFYGYQNMEGLLKTCDICYSEITNKASLDCGHELYVMCFLVMTTSSGFKCHMCRKQHKWTKEETLEETLSLLIREDDDNQFRTLVGMETSKAFEVIVSINNNSFVSNLEQHIIQFIIILEDKWMLRLSNS